MAISPRIPTTFEAVSGDLRIVITNAHVHYAGDWIMHCKALHIDTRHLAGVTSREQAQKAAMAGVRNALDKLVTAHAALVAEEMKG